MKGLSLVAELQLKNANLKAELERYKAFFREVAVLTSHHRVLGDSAVVYPRDLGKSLEKIDPEWWKGIEPVIGGKDYG